MVQAVLLYGADSWVVKDRDYKALRSFHRRAVRYMSGNHIRKLMNNQWTYPDHEVLLKQCGILDIDIYIYIKRRRGTLRKYLQESRSHLLQKAITTGKHARDSNKILWWNQSWIAKSEMKNHSKFWFSSQI